MTWSQPFESRLHVIKRSLPDAGAEDEIIQVVDDPKPTRGQGPDQRHLSIGRQICQRSSHREVEHLLQRLVVARFMPDQDPSSGCSDGIPSPLN